ncbi:hypothetical protein H7J72_04860 [Mycobacterium shimoidei]|nr:hypothetical protein [Mycobacterium shimoidei]MCV7257956.1 hypothetical protein [Mycobacterium shimoidei]ODR14106.1 hypothetical protein BHQ16_06610 [Mycobacterium shimoidei]
MDPVEINAGAWYLRASRVDDWLSDVRYTWVVCESTTGDSVAEVSFDPGDGAIVVAAADAHHDAATAASEAVRRFATSLPSNPY